MVDFINQNIKEEFIIIKKSDIENLGKKLMKEVYEHLHDDFTLCFKGMKEEKDKLEKYLIKFYIKKDKKKIKYFPYEIEDKIEDKNLDEIKESYQGVLKSIIEDEVIDVDVIFKVLENITLCFEIDEDLFCKKKHLIIFI